MRPSANVSQRKIIFITGTDTGVGKTVLTALLLHHLRQSSINVLAMKPFCSGGRGDVELLQSLQPGQLSDAEMNPFYFSQPLAPLMATKNEKRKPISMAETLAAIRRVALRCDRLLVEGSGGLLVPVGNRFTIADLIAKLDCQVIVVGHNRLGTINHTLLTIKHLKTFCFAAKRVKVVLMQPQNPDLSAANNAEIIAEMIRPIPVITLPFLGKNAGSKRVILKNHPKLAQTLEKIARWDDLGTVGNRKIINKYSGF
jgi:dethiobiotin synthetase